MTSFRDELASGKLFEKKAKLTLDEKLDLAFPEEPYENFMLRDKYAQQRWHNSEIARAKRKTIREFRE